jgi:hypothetical protein
MSRLPEALQEIETALQLTQDPAERRLLASQQAAIRSLLKQTGGTADLPAAKP